MGVEFRLHLGDAGVLIPRENICPQETSISVLCCFYSVAERLRGMKRPDGYLFPVFISQAALLPDG